MKEKQLSNPFSTGNGGGHFEAHVQASFVALMLTGGVMPCLPHWPITEIKLQGRIDGFNTDDLIVIVQNPDHREKRKLHGQIKHRINITKENAVFSEVIRAAWLDFNNPKIFTKGKDTIALICGPLNATDFHSIQWLLNQAKCTKNIDEFERQVTRTNFSPPKSEEKLKVFKHHLKLANNNQEVSEIDLYAFLNHFYVLGYDLGNEEGVVLSLLHSHISQYQKANPQFIWARIVDFVQTWNQNAGTITLARIPEDLKDVFKEPSLTYIPADLIISPEESNIDWSKNTYARVIALVNLIGAWEEKNEADIDIINLLFNNNYADFIIKARELLQIKDSPLSLKNGLWKISDSDRVSLWDALGSHIYDSDLDTFTQIIVKVLTEKNPAFELPPENRFAANIYGKVFTYSSILRRNLADSLALLGNRSDALINCSFDKANVTAILSIRGIFHEYLKWELWGSLNNLLPILAEAVPEEFLYSVENALLANPCPLAELFLQESQGITGNNYLTGLLWALEALAWDEKYLIRVCAILGELATFDPGGNSGNRPHNSLSTILLPWFPQTTAPIKKRKAAVRLLSNERPDVSWQLVIELLPDQQTTSGGTYKPKWRKIIPEEWKNDVTQIEYWEQVSFYAEMLISMAGLDTTKLIVAIELLNNLPRSAFDQLLNVLSSEEILALSEDERFPLWDKLLIFINKHRSFVDAEWSLKDDLLSLIEVVASKLAPVHPLKLYRHLFAENDYDLFDDRDDWDEQIGKLDEKRKEVIKEILDLYGVAKIIQFVKEVQSPIKVGEALGSFDEAKVEATLFPQYLDSDDDIYISFVRGYIWRRQFTYGWAWVDVIDKDSWSTKQIAKFLSFLPFTNEVWVRASQWLKNSEVEYWTNVDFNPYVVRGDLEFAIEKLLVYGRPYAAINCLHTILHQQKTLNLNQCVTALMSALSSSEASYLMNSSNIVELIKVLQNSSEIPQADLFNLEWAYLKLLDRYNRGKPKTLEFTLASDPDFFCEIIELVYRSNKSNIVLDLTEQKKAIVDNAWHLLRNWSVVPGTQKNGGFDGALFSDWLQRVKELSTESGHLEIALVKVGEVLNYAPSDPDGLWINHIVAKELNHREVQDMRSGYSSGAFNSRGVHWVDPTAKPELELSMQYKQKAEDVENLGYQRFAVTLRQLSATYENEAQRIIQENGIINYE
ncbi:MULTISPECIES: hypothetical protein [Paenibacillus]|uniref:Uncharacterized protein n=1 Tax=Paenibacillus borealis TaxID=160799 RepID=A0ABX3HC73_PAEBO|nr:hypothetical protein [Paenibacillus borealis]OMD47260.1 hypothetical protein BSK56_13840 [Paenibacillus borealis]